MTKVPARAPVRPPVWDPNDARYWDARDLEAELRRTFQVCHECRMCVTYCGSFPRLFESIDRDIYAYDTFAGMPRPAAVDRQGPDGALTEIWEANRTTADGDDGSTWMRASLESVQQRIRRLGYPDERLHFVKGMVEQTIPAVAPERIAVLRLDTDYYSSTRHELEHFYPRLSSGGVLIIDDYGSFRGSRQATDEFMSEQKLPMLLSRIDADARLAIKP